MPRIPRGDEPHARFHVMNRGIARRPLFESARDTRFFKAGLARVVRDGLLEVHAFSLMTTHYHLLLGSPCGRLADAMRRVQLAYSRWYNRGRLRDGPLFRGRFRSSRILSQAHWNAALAYIDRNPVDARVVAAPSAYPHGSAALHVLARGPRWLTRDAVAAALAERGGAVGAGPAAYDTAILGGAPPASVAEIVERRLREAQPQDDAVTEDPLDDLVRAASPRVQAWMVDKAGLADATSPGLAIVSSRTVLARIATHFATSEPGVVRLTERSRPARDVLTAGLLRTVCGLRFSEISTLVGCADSAAHRRVREHLTALRTLPSYAAVAAEILTASLRADFPAPVRPLDVPRRAPASEAGLLATR